MPFPYRRERVDRDVHALLADKAGDGDEHGSVSWELRPARRSPRLGRSVEPVVHDPKLGAGKSHDVPVEARESLGDADDERRLTGEQPLEIAPFPGAKGIVVVLRRDEHRSGARRGDRPVHVRVNEMGVNEVRLECAGRACCPAREQRVDVARARETLERDVTLGEGGVEGLRRRARVVEPEEARVDVSRAQPRQQLEDVSFRAAYSPDPLDVQNLHLWSTGCERRARTHDQPWTMAVAASRASRKSKGAR